MKRVTMKQVRKQYRKRVAVSTGASLRQQIRETPRSFFIGELSPKLAKIHAGASK